MHNVIDLMSFIFRNTKALKSIFLNRDNQDNSNAISFMLRQRIFFIHFPLKHLLFLDGINLLLVRDFDIMSGVLKLRKMLLIAKGNEMRGQPMSENR